MKLYVIGAGYVGLVSAACFARLGHHVTCVDVDAGRIELLNRGGVPIYEPGLAELIAEGMESGHIRFIHGIGEELRDAQVAFIAVGTPSRPDGRADLGYVLDAVRQCVPHLSGECVLVTKSTVPVGTGDLIEDTIRQIAPDLYVPVASNPEFLREGIAIRDFLQPDRIVVGAESAHAHDALARAYLPLTTAGAPLLATRRRTAELIKYAANSFLATKVSFINEISDLCERVGADVTEVAHGIGMDHRIGGKFLNAGPGFGGSCFPKDALALINTANDHGIAMPIIERVIHANELRKRNIARKVLAALDGSVRGKTIAVLGLAFKPQTDDMREAPSIDIVHSLDYWGARINVYDPAASTQARAVIHADVSYAADPYQCASGADAAVIVTEWDEFAQLDLNRLAHVMAQPVLVDLRNVFAPETAKSAGFVHVGVGRG